MNKSQEFLSKIKGQLVERRQELLSQLTGEVVDSQDVKGRDVGDEALSSFMTKLQDSLQQNEIEELHLIEDALARIDKNEYGVCISCGSAISERRLEYSPYAARCISCQEELEHTPL